jgi:lipoate-protein ligase B
MLMVTLWGIIIAVASYPFHQKLAGKLGGKDKLASVIVVLMGLGVIVIPMVLFDDSTIESLEKVVILTLEELGIKVHKKDGIVGIFTHKGKICAIGVEIKRWKTLHGIAINHQVDLNYFNSINPCGLGELGVTSILNEGKIISRQDVVEAFKKNFAKIFNTTFKQ